MKESPLMVKPKAFAPTRRKSTFGVLFSFLPKIPAKTRILPHGFCRSAEKKVDKRKDLCYNPYVDK